MPKNPEERTDENKQNSGLLDLKNPNTASSNCTFNEICSDEKAEDVEEDLNQAIWYKALFVYVPIQLFRIHRFVFRKIDGHVNFLSLKKTTSIPASPRPETLAGEKTYKKILPLFQLISIFFLAFKSPSIIFFFHLEFLGFFYFRTLFFETASLLR